MKRSVFLLFFLLCSCASPDGGTSSQTSILAPSLERVVRVFASEDGREITLDGLMDRETYSKRFPVSG